MRAAPLALAMVAAWSSPVYSSSLASFALDKVLADATPIFGSYVKETGNKAEWMKKYNDDTLLIHMNIPGTHDSATWNYSQATQDSLVGITDLNQTFRCQELSWIDMLNMGIRAFDLRYAFDPTNTTIIFYHSEALLSEIATLDDVLFGFYKWLDDHPSETLFLSLQYEGSTAKYASNDAALQLKLYNTLTSPVARNYFVQKKSELGTLGEARGKITLMRRFDLDQLASSYTTEMPGLHFSPTLWTDNDPNIALTYNERKNLTAYIEDYYQPTTPAGSNATVNIQWKYNATANHIVKATTEYPDSLFWTWASSENTDNVPPVWPRIMAIGNGTLTPKGGVNQRLVPVLKKQKGKRVGIVMFDYFDVPSDLIDEFLSL
ncbi:Palmitoyltransferase pfa4 [Penicillium atrosanguineum]|uniref:Palmitoyltransferase pfa4 n=1 Tax=Penicillium atrosanguineum TaxID=1132637 RepID=UPI00238BE3C4|nr:Palmitoyltransferase pfa4 [Penicillium atrosanguineum]KAJ5310808.1 Palmitoyltransferase pfa4 [Penicillium atrosanguineum]